jgi:glycosidase
VALNEAFTALGYTQHNANFFDTLHLAADESLQARIRTATDDKGRPFYNPNPGPDGLNSQQKIITFIENHDGINRFRVAGITERRHRLAQALVMTLPGIPCLYYGAEAALLDQHGKIGHDGETGRQMFFHKNGPTLTDVRNSPAFRDIAALAKLRATHPVLRHGRIHPLWVDSEGSSEDDGLFAFARISADNKSFAIILINASDQPSTTRSGVTCPPLRTVKSTPSKPNSFAAAPASAQLKNCKCLEKT